jgi:hypothetical protein
MLSFIALGVDVVPVPCGFFICNQNAFTAGKHFSFLQKERRQDQNKLKLIASF